MAGKVAQFGRGVLADVSVKLLDEFAQCLSEELKSEQATSRSEDVEPSPAVQEFAKAVVEASPDEPAAGNGTSAGPRQVDAPEPKPVDLLGTAGPPLAKRLVPAGLLAALVVLLLLRRRRR